MNSPNPFWVLANEFNDESFTFADASRIEDWVIVAVGAIFELSTQICISFKFNVE